MTAVITMVDGAIVAVSRTVALCRTMKR
jgi:hypothetical protein